MDKKQRDRLRSFNTDDFPVVWRAMQDGYKAEIVCDDGVECGDPRDASNIGRIIHWHTRYTIASDAEDIVRVFGGHEMLPPTREDVERWLRDERGAITILPLGMLDHSGISFYVGSGSAVGDSDGWDSGQVGFIYATRESCDECGVDPTNTAEIERQLRGEVRALDAYARGDVYFHRIVSPTGEEVDACYGYLAVEDGEDDGLDDLRWEIHDWLISYAADERVERERAANSDIATA